MKIKILLLLLLFATIAQNLKSQLNGNFYADSLLTVKFQYLDSLLNVDSLPKGSYSKLLIRCTKEVGYIVQLTGIESTVPISGLMGRFGISKEDFLNWSLWYFRNKRYLYWENGVVKVIK